MFSGGDNSQMNGDMPHDGGGGGGHEIGDELKKTGKYAFMGSKLVVTMDRKYAHTIIKKKICLNVSSCAGWSDLSLNLFPTILFIIISRLPTYPKTFRVVYIMVS